MNLAIRGIEGQVEYGDSFRNDRHPDLKADYILANPPFNVKEWQRDQLQDDKRWAYGMPPAGNANFAWIQHFHHHLSPRGIAGFALANGSMSSSQSGEGEIRKKIIEDDLVDCIIALPGQLFRSTQIPACLWFLRRGRRQRRGETLFIDARRLGHMADRTHRDLSIEDIAGTYHAWRGDKEAGDYADIPGFCKSAILEEIQHDGHVLTPGRYVGAAPLEDDGEPFQEKMTRLAGQVVFDLSFSENVDAGYARIRDHALTISGGEITNAQRKEQGSNQNWTITVKPDGNGAITITLPETSNCDATDAICTYDGRKLSGSTSAPVAGPV